MAQLLEGQVGVGVSALPGCKDSAILPHIGIVTKDEMIGVYTATNCDILADDWERIK